MVVDKLAQLWLLLLLTQFKNVNSWLALTSSTGAACLSALNRVTVQLHDACVAHGWLKERLLETRFTTLQSHCVQYCPVRLTNNKMWSHTAHNATCAIRGC